MKGWGALSAAFRARPPSLGLFAQQVRKMAHCFSEPTAIVAVLLTICSWSPRAFVPEASLDSSWEIAMHLARVQGLHFGSELAFTYGPLGFLVSPVMVSGWLSFCSTVYLFALHALFAYLIMRRVPVSMGLLGRSGIAAVVLLCLRMRYFFPELAAIDGFLIVVALFEDERPAEFWIRTAMGLAVAGSLHLLVKLGSGIVLLAMGAVVALNAPNRSLRGLGRWAGSGAITLLAVWLILGQRLVDLPRWLYLSQQFLAGYSEAMSLSPGGFKALEPVIGVTAGILLIVAIALRPAGARPRRTKRLAVLLVTGCVLYFAKQGFVRHDFHSHIYFVFLLVAGLTLPMFARRPVTFGVANAVLFTLFLTSQERGIPLSAGQIASSVRAFAEQIRLFVSADYRRNFEWNQLFTLRRSLAVPEVMVTKIGRSRVHVDPWMTSAIWAYGFDWKPVPIFQRFAAYTPALDAANAEMLADPRGPEAILLQKNHTIDRHHLLFESPAYALSRLCHFGVTEDQENWQLLQRIGRRCGPERVMDVVFATEGLAIKVPQARTPNALVVARIRARERGATKLARLIFWSGEGFTIEVDDKRYDLPIGLAGAPLLLRVPANHVAPEVVANYSQVILRGFAGSARVEFAEIALSE